MVHGFRPSCVHIELLAAALLTVCTAPAAAQSPACAAPSTYSAYSGTDSKPVPTAPLFGAANSIVIDPTFGSSILRVTDHNTLSGESFIPTDAGFHRTWNANATAIQLTGPHGDSYWLEFNAGTFKVGDGSSHPVLHPLPVNANWEWSTVNPDILYFLNGAQLAKYDKSSAVVTNLGGPSNGDPVTSWAVVVGQDNWVCSAAGLGSQDTYTELFCINPAVPSSKKLIDVVNKKINGVLQTDPNWPTSAPGQTIGIHSISGGTGASWLGVTFHQQSWGGNGDAVFNLATNTWSLVTNADIYFSGHVSVGNGLFANGSGSINGSDSRGMVVRDASHLMDASRYLFIEQPPVTVNWFDGEHSSWLNSACNPTAPVLQSRYTLINPSPWLPWIGEITAAATDGSNTVWRFAHNHNLIGNYYGEAFAQISGDGKWALFSSPWDGTLGASSGGDFGLSTRIDTFVVRLVPGATGPAITVSPAVVAPGALVTVTVSTGPANPKDVVVWYCPATAADTAFLDYAYLNNTKTAPVTGLPGATVTLPAPATAGTTCQARWFANVSVGSAPPIATSATVTVGNPTPAITTLSPASVAAGSAAFALTVTGAGFVSGASATVGGASRATTWVSATQLTVAVLASDVVTVSTLNITVGNPAPCVMGGCTSGVVALNVIAPPPAPTITALAPTTIAVGVTGFTLTVTGTNFVGTSAVQVDGVSRPTTFGSATTLTAQLLASDRATGGTRAITVVTPAPGGGTSNSATLTVTGPTIVASPSVVAPGGTVTFTLTNGPGNPKDVLVWYCPATAPDAAFLDYAYLNNTKTAPVTGLASATVTLVAPTTAGATCQARWFANVSVGSAPPIATSATVTVGNPTPAISALGPASVAAGSAAFALTVTGTGFVAGATVQINGGSRTTTVVSGTQLTATILASDVTTIATPAITVVNPGPCVSGWCTASGQPLLVVAPPSAPTLTSLNPATVAAAALGFPVTVTGTNFVGTSVVRLDGVSRPTTFGSATTLTVQLLASDRAAGGTHTITLLTPAPGGGTSGSATLTVTGPTVIVSPAVVAPGGIATMTVSNGPANPGDVVVWYCPATAPDAAFLDYAYLNNTKTAPVTGLSGATVTLLAPTTAGATCQARWFANVSVGSAPPIATSATVTVGNPTPAITAFGPASVAAGSPAFALTLLGTGFVPGASATVGGATRTTTWVSATQLTVSVLASDVITIGTPAVIVGNPVPCVVSGCTSVSQTLGVIAPPAAPAIASLTPATVAAGATGFTLTVAGTNFVGTSVVQVDGVSRPTTYGSAASLTAQLPASDRSAGGTHTITVVTPAPGGGTSTSATLTVTGPTATVSPSVVSPGGLVTVTVSNGPANPGDVAVWYCPATAPDAAFLDYAYLNNTKTAPVTGLSGATVTLPAPATAGVTCQARWFANVSVGSAPPIATSATVTVGNPTPVITALGPASVAAGSAAFALTVTGTGFVAGTTMQINGGSRTTTVVSGTQLTATILASDVTTIATPAITVVNPAPCVSGGCTSVSQMLSVVAPPPAPTVTALAPATIAAGATGFSLTVTGTNFVGTSVVQVDGASRPTTSGSATALTAQLLASDRGTSGTHTITVLTPAPGGGTSGSATLTVTGPTVTVSPSVVAPGGLVTVTVSNGPANPKDVVVWYCPAAAADTAFLDYAYLNNTKTAPVTGLPGATVTLPAPATGGTTCQARWFASVSVGSAPPIATSATVAVN